jgi:hypothetical protein
MFERFTDKARTVVVAAKAKATERDDDQIRPVHMLYGLAATDGAAARALTALRDQLPVSPRKAQTLRTERPPCRRQITPAPVRPTA